MMSRKISLKGGISLILAAFVIFFMASCATVYHGYLRESTGKVKITEIVDEHFARATIISGKAEKDDIVELTRR